jgi:hypothetical protein
MAGIITAGYNTPSNDHYNDYYASEEFHDDVHRYANEVKYTHDLVAKAKSDLCTDCVLTENGECVVIALPDVVDLRQTYYIVEE